MVLYPNMKLSSYVDPKRRWETALALGDITMLWKCNDAHRERAKAHGIVSWRDERLTPELLGFDNPMDIDVLNRILKINRCQDPTQWILKDPRLHDVFPILSTYGSKTNLFIDFEYVDDLVYMIGIFDGSTRQYTSLWAQELSPQGTDRLYHSFSEFLRQIPCHKLCWYWYAEDKVLKKANQSFADCEWWDLWKISRHVAVKRAFDFSLKSFVRALFLQNKIPFSYDDEYGSACQNGQASIQLAKSFYASSCSDLVLKQDLESYNQKDCEALWYFLTLVSPCSLS